MAGFYVGHGRHWHFVEEAGRSQEDLMRMLTEVYASSASKVLFQVGETRLIVEPEKELAVGVLAQGTQIRSAFPYCSGGHIWPIELKQVNEWPGEIEAQHIGSCKGAKVCWFDPHYAQCAAYYKKVSGPVVVQMNALAYQVWKTEWESPEKEAQMGQMKAYLPLGDQEGFDASHDEIQFMSHAEAIRPLDFHGVPMEVITLTVALPDDFAMRLNLYTPHTDRQATFAVGDRIGGVCWLFGKLAQP